MRTLGGVRKVEPVDRAIRPAAQRIRHAGETAAAVHRQPESISARNEESAIRADGELHGEVVLPLARDILLARLELVRVERQRLDGRRAPEREALEPDD